MADKAERVPSHRSPVLGGPAVHPSLMPKTRTLKRRAQREAALQRRRAGFRGMSLAKADELLQAVYLPAVSQLLNNSNVLLKYFDKGNFKGEYSGSYYVTIPASLRPTVAGESQGTTGS